ncbi:MAG TPA: BTAD domain-containing putative transcriptional regulator [Longimicrobium sp.]|jgi:serine/threonine-protein kinase|uniref:BTAD domain-containing putative transcriptional regulator n=1 Tax=Longimicrobium sp. TaxID=2029185 RepID=UPI002ED7C68E
MLKLTTLGTICVERDGVPVPVPQPKRVALLAYLALARPRGLHRRDTLLAMFWPELPQERARNALRQALHQLRSACGDGVIVTRGMHEVGIDPAHLSCDAHLVDAAAARGDAAEVAEAYAGDLLPGLHAAGAGDWEDWLARERMRLRAAACAAGRALALAAREAGDPAAAARWARWTCAVDPLDETSVCWAMKLLVECGLRGAALELFEQFSAQLRRELGVEPGSEAAALARAARSAEPHAGSAAPLVAPAQPVAIASPAPGPAPTGFRPDVGRAAPRQRLRWVVAACLMVVGGVIAAAPRAHGTQPRRDRVAVLAFRAGDGAAASAALARETTERVRAALAASGMEVASPGAVGRIAAGAGTVVTGALYPRGDAVEVRVVVSDEVAEREVASLSAVLLPSDTAAAAALTDRVLAAVASHADPAFGWVGSTSRPTGSPGHRLFVEGLRALRDERADAAAAAFRDAARADTGFTLAWLMGAAIDAEQGRTAAADTVARRLAARQSTLAPADRLLLLWLQRSVSGDRAGALAAMEELTASAPELEMGHFQAALEAVRYNRPADALRHLEVIHPERGFSRGWASYWATRADALHMLGRHADELAHIRRGLTLYPHLGVLRDYELRALAALGRTGEVLRRMEAYAVIPASGGWEPLAATLHGAYELQAHGHASAARVSFTRAVDLARARFARNPEDASSRAVLATTLYAAGMDAEARRVLGQWAEERPRCRGCVGALGVLSARGGDRPAAVAADRALAAGPRTVLVLLWRARIASTLGDGAGAASLVREAVALGYAYDGTTHTDRELGPLFP